MVPSETKNHLIKEIRRINDPEIIHEIYRLLNIDLDEKTYQTTHKQKERITSALADIEKGEVYDEREANEQTEQWLNQKG
jgi:hypothetical protein